MKKFCKVIISVAGIFIIAGALTVLAAVIVSNRSQNNIGDMSFTFRDADISYINCSIPFGKTTFREGDEWSVRFIDIPTDRVMASVTNGELDVSIDPPGAVSLFGWNIGLYFDFNTDSTPETVITYPAGADLGSIYCESGIARISAANLSSGYLLIQAPFGYFDINGSHIEEQLSLDTLCGYVKVSGSTVGRTVLDVRTGYVDARDTGSDVTYNYRSVIKK